MVVEGIIIISRYHLHPYYRIIIVHFYNNQLGILSPSQEFHFGLKPRDLDI